MKYIVDVRLKGSTFVIIRQTLKELSTHSGSQCKTLISEVLIKAVESKLRKRSFGIRKEGITLSSKNLLLEGQGSIEISLSPTEAQESIVKSLIKVILHQIGSHGNYNLTDGQENLLISLCVQSIQVEQDGSGGAMLQSHKSASQQVEDIFSNPEIRLQRENDGRASTKSFHVRCFCCLEDYSDCNEAGSITEEFDKIDIQDSEGLEDADTTLICGHPLLAGIPISQETLSQSKISLLPSKGYEGLWESLHFDDNLKQRLYSYATVSLKLSKFSDHKVSQALISNNKILLVHGPPGTGKTTICKALCQKLAIRHDKKSSKLFHAADYEAIMIELSCSRIFSRWFGESAKNLEKIFQDVELILTSASNKDKFVCLLMDEVETLASCRSSLMNKNETTDGIRVVNTLLTKLDNLKKHNNVLILATSNLASSLDAAFLDRADGVFFAGTPSEYGTSIILSSTIRELIETGVIYSKEDSLALESRDIQESILKISQKCAAAGISGRTLRKLPLICLSEHLTELPVKLRDFLVGLAYTVKDKNHQGHALSKQF